MVVTSNNEINGPKFLYFLLSKKKKKKRVKNSEKINTVPLLWLNSLIQRYGSDKSQWKILFYENDIKQNLNIKNEFMGCDEFQF